MNPYFQEINKVTLPEEEGGIGIIHLVCTQNFWQKLTFLTPWFAHVRMRSRGDTSFSESFAYILNEWSHSKHFFFCNLVLELFALPKLHLTTLVFVWVFRAAELFSSISTCFLKTMKQDFSMMDKKCI